MDFSVDTVYWICFSVGFVWAVATGLLAGMFGGDHDMGGADVGDFGADGADFSGSLHFSPLSPTIIATFLTFFGGSGLMCTKFFGIDDRISVIPAMACALAAGYVVYKLMDYLFRNVQGGIVVDKRKLIGGEAEAIITIPVDGLGEIAFATSGGRSNNPARTTTGKPIPSNTAVRIVRIVGGVYYVEPIHAGADDASSSEATPEKSAGGS